jgi:signal transduction histidine kinase
LRFSVRDQGIGISSEEASNLGKMFGRLEVTKDNVNQNGLGFGLAISQMIIQKIGGKIDIR